MSAADLADAERIAETGTLAAWPRRVGGRLPPVVHALRGGRVGTCPLDRYRLPKACRDLAVVVPGDLRADTAEVLPLLAEIADRVAPWVEVHIVPAFLRVASDSDIAADFPHYVAACRRYSCYGGTAFKEHDFILLASCGPTGMLQILAHELLHMMWQHLSDEAINVLTDAVANGLAWPGDYLANTEERVARMFEAWVWGFAEGMPPRLIRDRLSVDGIFDAIWSGSLADGLIRSGDVEVPEAVKRRRGLLPKPVAVPEMGLADRAVEVVLEWLTGTKF
jgi:hypothetical protein